MALPLAGSSSWTSAKGAIPLLRAGYRALVPQALRHPVWVAKQSLRRTPSVALRCPIAYFGRRIIERRLLPTPSCYWVFILGVNNSGTTILARLLALHPEIRSLPNEGDKLTEALAKDFAMGVSRLWTERLECFRRTDVSPRSEVPLIKYDWSRLYPARPGILLEKSPPDTVRSRWLQRNFRPSRFLAIVRNPYAVVEGIRRRDGYSVKRAARHWVTANRLLLADMEHLRRCKLMRYEDLCADPRGVLTETARFLERPWAIPERVGTQPLPVHNLRGEPSPVRNFNNESISRLSCREIAEIDTIAAPLMEQLRYARLSVQPP